jgi:Taurine catabolism dioxygenase TauD, TfdA family
MNSGQQSGAEMEQHLGAHGFLLLEQVGGVDAAMELLSTLGTIVPQYDGQLAHEIRPTKDYENLVHSKTTREIFVHTEAPGWDPVPKYLALYCHRQARCGGGQTTLCDGRQFLRLLDDRERDLVYHRELAFPGAYGRTGGAEWTTVATMVSRGVDGAEIIRFSYTHLMFGDYTPPADLVAPLDRLPLGPEGVALARRGSEIFRRHCLALLIPDNGMLIWDNHRMLHARASYIDHERHLTRFFVGR